MKRIVKVYFDDKPLKLGHAVRGIGYYTKNLLSELERSKEISLVNNIEQADLVHYPYFDLFRHTLKVSSKPTVVTIYDTIPLIYPQRYPCGIRGKLNFLKQKKALQKVSGVITISETSKKDIVRFLDIPENKIFPIYLAPAPHFRKLEGVEWKKEIAQKYSLPQKFVLYVGDVNYNKNIISLVEACKLAKIKLVIVGKQAALQNFDKNHIENRDLAMLIDRFGNDADILRLGYVEDSDLVKIYNLSAVYCQPSLYEGFGIPVLEAMGCGVPVVAVKTQALVEIAQGNCVYSLSPKPEDLAHAIKTVTNNVAVSKDLRAKGLGHVDLFSWEKTMKETIEIYHKLYEKY